MKNAVKVALNPSWGLWEVVTESFFFHCLSLSERNANTTILDSTRSNRIELSMLITTAFPVWKKEKFCLKFHLSSIYLNLPYYTPFESRRVGVYA